MELQSSIGSMLVQALRSACSVSSDLDKDVRSLTALISIRLTSQMKAFNIDRSVAAAIVLCPRASRAALGFEVRTVYCIYCIIRSVELIRIRASSISGELTHQIRPSPPNKTLVHGMVPLAPDREAVIYLVVVVACDI
jgi:hypothetical protein